MRQNWLEWLVLAASAAVVVGVVGFLVIDGLTDEGRPPAPRVDVLTDEGYEVSGGWIIPATVRNDGDEVAVALVLRATATVEGTEEESEVSVDYLPPGTDVEVSFGFSNEPAGSVTVQTVGFRLP